MAVEFVDFGVSLASLFWPITLLTSVLYAWLLAVYLLQGRGACYWPTMSETTIDNRPFFGDKVPVCIGIVTLVTRAMLAWFVRARFDTTAAANIAMAALAAVGSAGHVGLAAAPLHTDPVGHALWAAAAFGSSIAFKVLFLAVTARRAGWRPSARRALLLAAEAAGALVTANSNRFVAVRSEDSLSALGEWVFVFSGLAFWATLPAEFAQSHVLGAITVE
jgi:hypothetical protein